MKLPTDQRLEQALYLLDEVTGQDGSDLAWLRRNWGLSKGEATVFCALNRAAPRALTKQALLAVLPNPEVESRIIDVYICKLRKKVPMEVLALWGFGYQILEKFDIPKFPVEVSSRTMRQERWTAQQDLDLKVMWCNGSDLSVIAEELDRTERGVLDRASHLKLRLRE